MGKIFIFIILVIFPDAISGADEQRYTVPLEDSPSCYAHNAPVTMIEFLDYQ